MKHLVLGALLLACRREQPPAPKPSPSVSAAAASASAGARAATPAMRLLIAEHDRDPGAIPDGSVLAISAAERVAAVRALSRTEDERARERLLGALADSEPEVVRWAAFGLGRLCKGSEDATVRALNVRAAGLSAASAPATSPALETILRALGRCANDDAERTLRGYLDADAPLAESAAVALGTLGMRRGKLDQASYARLLDRAASAEKPLDSALFALGRLEVPEGPLRARLVELAPRFLERSETARRFLVRALGRSGAAAVPALRAVAEAPKSSALERAEVFRELARIGGADAQHALSELLPAQLAPGPALTDADHGPDLGALLTLLEALTDARAQPALERLSRFELPATDPARRHAVLLRCAAARVLAGKSSRAPDLVACDPDPDGRIGNLAKLAVLDRGELVDERARIHRALAEGRDPVVRQRALEILAGHREAPNAVESLLKALADGSPGTLASAAELLGDHPDRAQSAPEAGSEPRPDPKLLELLATRFRLEQKRPNIEVRASLIDAASALGVLALKPDIARDCKSENPTLRNHAEKALRAFGEHGLRCARAAEPGRPPEELERLRHGTQRLVFETDAGALELELDADAAPVSVTRMVELAQSGFFDGVAVHRVVPGFVVQFGDPGGDGYGGAERRALRDELGPEPFEPGSVGIALAGRDTGSSQLFVTLGSYPHLDGEYARIGRAGPGWARLVRGDVLRRVRPAP
jgi:cyclophilin family peptidyl-prolyl cis-trans isomerase/HEAT repeat protein